LVAVLRCAGGDCFSLAILEKGKGNSNTRMEESSRRVAGRSGVVRGKRGRVAYLFILMTGGGKEKPGTNSLIRGARTQAFVAERRRRACVVRTQKGRGA